ncbi:50S ribosomal protein L25 [Candidatus Kapabacteria bacterium]|nr:50S ribosomal protein L25 [Candidatus Kapabacteria bacterium]
MADVALKVEKRNTGKRASKDVRQAGKVPGVYYFKGVEGTPIVAETLALRPVVYTAMTKMIKLEIDGAEPVDCVLKDISFDPVTEKIRHFDLLGVKPDHKITVYVPIKFVGLSKGVVSGGVFKPVMHKLKITCLPGDLPDYIEADISDLDVSQKLNLDSLRNDKLEFAIKSNPVVCQVSRPRVKAAVGAAE